MNAINATPESIREVFRKEYVIPEYQRPYSWEEEHCDKLWNDILDFYYAKSSDLEKYFLGNIVVYPSDGAFAVIDGQQRLTSILLLTKALFSKANTFSALESLLKKRDKKTEQLINELRLLSSVEENKDKEELKNVILENKTDGSNRIAENYRYFLDKINKWQESNRPSSEEFERLIFTFLDQVVLLPITCENMDDSLTIFETINNRGMSLTDADIFKAKLYKNINENERDDFIKKWNALKHHEWLFRIYMHIDRAQRGITDKEIGLRQYFTDNPSALSDCSATMNGLEKIHAAYSWNGSNEINVYWKILDFFPNQYWNYPVYVFLHKYGSVEDGIFVLDEDSTKEFEQLIKATVRYFYIKGLVYNAVNTVKDTVFKVCKKISKCEDYLAEYDANLISNDFSVLKTQLNENRLGRYARGLVFLSAYLNDKQDKAKYDDFIWGKCDIEHILPKKWNNYDGWNEESWAANINTLGNLVPLEREINITASNEFFKRKKEGFGRSKGYQDSAVQDALDLVDIAQWTPLELEKRQAEVIKRLSGFFGFEI